MNVIILNKLIHIILIYKGIYLFIFILMILLTTLYLGALYSFGAFAIRLSNYYNNYNTNSNNNSTNHNNNPSDKLSLKLNIDPEDKLYKSVLNEYNKNKLEKNEQVLVCCTGDTQSMALLAIVLNIFGNENVHVLTINHHKSNNMTIFVHDICDLNDLQFHHYNYYNISKIQEYRY